MHRSQKGASGRRMTPSVLPRLDVDIPYVCQTEGDRNKSRKVVQIIDGIREGILLYSSFYPSQYFCVLM